MSKFIEPIPKPDEEVVNTPEEVKAYYRDMQDAVWAEEDRQPSRGEW